MAVVFTPGQKLTRNDLNIFIRDTNNVLFDPNYIAFTLEDTEGNLLLANQQLITPVKESTGYYWSDVTIPEGTAPGPFVMKWYVRDYVESQIQQIEQRFGVIKRNEPVSFTPTIGGVVYYPGQSLTDQDLYIVVRNHLGNQVDPYYISYDIFQRIHGMDLLISPMGLSPIHLGVGKYYAKYQIPSDALAGDYYIRWTFKDAPDSADMSAVQEFAVVTGSVIISNPFASAATSLIRKLRFILRDNNPDRNYHFMPPAQEEVVQGFTQKFGYVWEDEELYEYIDIAISEVNNYPPREGWDMSSLPSRMFSMVLNYAATVAIRALAVSWAHQEWDGSISGVSLNLEKSAKYQSLMANFEESFKAQLTEHKEFGVRFIVGVRQPRYQIGVTSALGPYSRIGVQSRRNYIGGTTPMF